MTSQPHVFILVAMHVGRLLTLVCIICLAMADAASGQYVSPWDAPTDALKPARRLLREGRSPDGILVESVSSTGVGVSIGLRAGDLITSIADAKTPTSDDYAIARRSLVGHGPVTMTVWRAGRPIQIEDPMASTLLGISAIDYSSMMDRILASLETGNTDAAADLLKSAQEANSLSRRNLLTAKLLIMPDEDPMESPDVLGTLRELMDVVGSNDYLTVWTALYDHQRPHASAFVLQQAIVRYPGNLTHYSNLAMNLARLKRNEEAEDIASRAQKLGPNAYGVFVLEWVFSRTAENRGDWKTALDHMDAGLKVYHTRNNDDTAMRVVYLSARLNNLDAFKATRVRAEAIGRPSDIEPYLDALEAYLLSAQDQKAAAQLVKKWTTQPDKWQIVYDHWKQYFPEVAANWERLR